MDALKLIAGDSMKETTPEFGIGDTIRARIVCDDDTVTTYLADKNGNYVENLSHEYASEGEYTVRMTLKGGVDEQIVTFKNVVGVKKIDLTEM